MPESTTPPIAFVCPGNEFVMPYVDQLLVTADFEQLKKGDTAIMLSSTDIYEPDSEKIIDEASPLRTTSAWKKSEDDFIQASETRGLKWYIFRAAPIVGTGMNGAIRELAEEIARGLFMHFPGNETQLSVVHASDIARAAEYVLTNNVDGHIFNLTDNCDPTLHDIAEALAYRMKNKRISTISTLPQQWFMRLIYGRKRMARYTTTVRYSSAAIQSLGFMPTNVCDYLHTHVYDDNSL